MTGKIRPYERKDFESLVRISDASLKTPGWSPYYPEGWTRDTVADEFLLNRNSQMLRNPEEDPLLIIAENDSGEVEGALIGQSLSSFLKKRPASAQNLFRQNGGVSNCYYQRHIALLPDAKNKFSLIGLFKKLKQTAKEKGYNELVVGVPPLNDRGLDLMTKLRYKEFGRESESEHKIPLVYFRQNLLI